MRNNLVVSPTRLEIGSFSNLHDSAKRTWLIPTLWAFSPASIIKIGDHFVTRLRDRSTNPNRYCSQSRSRKSLEEARSESCFSTKARRSTRRHSIVGTPYSVRSSLSPIVTSFSALTFSTMSSMLMLLKRRWPSTFLEERLFLSSTGTSMSRTKSCVSNETSRHCGNSWTSQNPVCRTKLHTLSEVFNLTGEPELAGFGLSGEHRKTLGKPSCPGAWKDLTQNGKDLKPQQANLTPEQLDAPSILYIGRVS